ncbi:hypothetical protein BRC87_12285 [Halobacteriales archaeon QS_4_66_20]|nr:MAG: hypothetical protein BRC87_12285 [Halobacteriales archaeon QS_4_66_20]
MVIIKKLVGDEYEKIGEVRDGEVVDGGERIERLLSSVRGDLTESNILSRFGGPYLVAVKPEGDEDST